MGNVKLEKRKSMTIAYVEHTGPYDKVPWEEYMKTLYGWAKEKKVMPGFYPLGIYLDDPEKTPKSKCRSQIAIPLYGKVKSEGKIKVRKLPSMTVAAISHKGPGEEFKNTYKQLTEWVEGKGLKWAGPPIEIYTKKPEVVGGKPILYAKVLAPVKKK